MITRRTASRATSGATRRTAGRGSTPPKPSAPPKAASNGSSGSGGYGGARSAVQGIRELGDIEFTDDVAFYEYCTRIRDLMRAMAAEVEFGGYQAEAALRGIRAVPGLSAIRARKVARPLLVAAESCRIAGAKAVESYALFLRLYAPEIEAVRGPRHDKPTFEIRPDGPDRM